MSPLQVLVLDDDGLVCEAVCLALRDAGFASAGVTDISAALDAIAKAVPIVVVTDLQMPGAEDVAIVALLRRRFPKLGIVAMSGDHDLARMALALGANVFLPKPLRPRVIAECMATFLPAAAKARAVFTTSAGVLEREA